MSVNKIVVVRCDGADLPGDGLKDFRLCTEAFLGNNDEPAQLV